LTGGQLHNNDSTSGHISLTGSYVSLLKFYGGVPATILCDNLRTAVTRPDRYEPVFTDICYQLSEHYGTTFSATRPFISRNF